MGTTNITLHGRVIHMPDSYAVLKEVDARVCDPLKVLTATGKAGGNIVDLQLTQAQCIDLLTIGVRHSGSTQESDEAIAESVYGLGPEQYIPLAILYLSALCGSNVQGKAASPKAAAVPRRAK